MIYTDGVHLTAQSLSELCAYGLKVGLDSLWLQAGQKNLHPHFLICGKVKERVLADASVLRVSTREFVKVCKQYFTPDVAASKGHEDISSMMPTESDYNRMINNIFKRAGIERGF
jgi:hypothetical protein